MSWKQSLRAPFANLEGFLFGVDWSRRSAQEVAAKHGTDFLARLAFTARHQELTTSNNKEATPSCDTQ